MAHVHRELGTHTVTNQVPPLEDINLFGLDRPLQEALVRNGGGWAKEHVLKFGGLMGSAKMFEEGRLANVHVPEVPD